MKQTYWMVMDYLVQRKENKRTFFYSYFSQAENKMLLSIVWQQQEQQQQKHKSLANIFAVYGVTNPYWLSVFVLLDLRSLQPWL
jgi:hypothetical protein